jgi:hypothetical protein
MGPGWMHGWMNELVACCCWVMVKKMDMMNDNERMTFECVIATDGIKHEEIKFESFE